MTAIESVPRLTIGRLLRTIKKEDYQIVFKKWSGKNYIYLGICDTDKLHIDINYNRIYKLSRSEKRVLFVHEAIHAFFDAKSTHFNIYSLLHNDDVEIIVDALAKELCSNATKHQLKMLDGFWRNFYIYSVLYNI